MITLLVLLILIPVLLVVMFATGIGILAMVIGLLRFLFPVLVIYLIYRLLFSPRRRSHDRPTDFSGTPYAHTYHHESTSGRREIHAEQHDEKQGKSKDDTWDDF